MVTGLHNLPVSLPNQAIQKTGPETFANVTVGSPAPTFVDGEVVSGNDVTWVLVSAPLPGSLHLFAFGQRLKDGAANDYILTGRNITTMTSFTSGSLIADYRT
jgi:hypothetical protein